MEELDDVAVDIRIPVLLVEDEEHHVVLLKDALRSITAPIALVHVDTLKDAIEQIGRVEFGVVLLDLHLPDSRGIRTIEAVSKLHDTVVVMTSAGRDVQLQAVRAGADDFLVKGESTRKEIRRAVECALERRFRRREVDEAHRAEIVRFLRTGIDAIAFESSETHCEVIQVVDAIAGGAYR